MPLPKALPPMRRINVVGTVGSGKSYFAQALAARLSLPYIQMDQLHWKPNWEEPSTDDLLTKLESELKHELWVLDGNYSKCNVLKWRYTDTVIWLDYSFTRTFVQLFRRTIVRVVSKQEIWPDTGNIETLRGTFMSHDSILLWFFRTYFKNRRQYGAMQTSPQYRHLQFIRLRNPQESQEFLQNLRTLSETKDLHS